ncbi:MAG: glycosyltransferase, partial [Gemmatimonadetes bacterium]|nr:glycosyltransferase [Gemmatimonadota bacterium]
MVILHVLSPGTVGGLERVVEGLARGHRLRGHQVHVASILDGPWEPPLHTALRDAGVAVHSLVMPPRAYWRERSAVGALCRRLAPDVVHTHGYRCDVLDAGVARRTGIPTVTTVHGFTFGGWKNRVYETIQRAAFRRFDAVVAVSRPLAGELARAGVPAGRIRVVPNA